MSNDTPAPRAGRSRFSHITSAAKRGAIKFALHARATLGEYAQAIADACATPAETKEPRQQGRSTGSFADHHLYRNIIKHKELAPLFKFENPFYRCHDGRMGVQTWIDGRQYLNFASYDYLGLNHHPAVAEAAKQAIERYGTTVSASRIVAGERPLHRELEGAL